MIGRGARRLAIWSTWALVAGLGLRAIGQLGGLPDFVGDVLIYWPGPLWLFGLALALVCSRERWWLQFLFFAAGTACLSMEMVGGRSGNEPPTEPRLRVLSWNVFQGNGDPEGLFEIIAAVDADVVLLQEFPPELYFAKEKWLAERYPVVRYDERLLSATRLPVVHAEVLSLSPLRSAVILSVGFAGEVVDITSAHLTSPRPYNFYERWNRQQQELELLLDALKPSRVPQLVMGDFNMPRGSSGYRRLANHFADAWSAAKPPGVHYSFPTILPVTAIDHAWVSKHWRVHTISHPASGASDHLPTVIEVSPRESL